MFEPGWWSRKFFLEQSGWKIVTVQKIVTIFYLSQATQGQTIQDCCRGHACSLRTLQVLHDTSRYRQVASTPKIHSTPSCDVNFVNIILHVMLFYIKSVIQWTFSGSLFGNTCLYNHVPIGSFTPEQYFLSKQSGFLMPVKLFAKHQQAQVSAFWDNATLFFSQTQRDTNYLLTQDLCNVSSSL